MNLICNKSIFTDRLLFSLKQFSEKVRLNSFKCVIDEYNEYLIFFGNNILLCLKTMGLSNVEWSYL